MALAERGEMLPGVAPREAWCRRMNMHMMRAGRPRSRELRRVRLGTDV